MWTDSTTVLQPVLQWINSYEKQPIFVAFRVCETLELTSVGQWKHVPTKDNPADAGTSGMSAEFLQLSNWVKGPHSYLIQVSLSYRTKTSLITSSSGSTKQSLEDTVSLVPSIFPFDKVSSYGKYLRIAAYFSKFCQKISATVNKMVALLTLLSLTKPRVIYSTWCKESLLKLKRKIFMTTNLLNGAAELLHIHHSLVHMDYSVPQAASSS